MVTVVLTKAAQRDFDALPAIAQGRVAIKLKALEAWPHVVGVKALNGVYKGQYRVRAGDYRIRFSVTGQTLTVHAITDRKDAY